MSLKERKIWGRGITENMKSMFFPLLVSAECKQGSNLMPELLATLESERMEVLGKITATG